MDTLSLLLLIGGLITLTVALVLFWRSRRVAPSPAPEPAPAPTTLDMQVEVHDGAEIATIADEAPPAPERRLYRPRTLALIATSLVILAVLGIMLNERLTARAPERLVVIVAPFADSGDGQTGRNVANELTRLLADQIKGDATVAMALRSPVDAADALALAEAERADLLIWGEVEPGALLDSPSLLPSLVYTPSGPYGPQAWLGYQSRFAMPRSFALAREPINGQAVLVPLVLAITDYVNGNPDQSHLQLTRLRENYPGLSDELPSILRGNIFWARGFYSEAADAYRLALAEASTDPALLANNLAVILRDGGDAGALAAFAEAVRLLDRDGRDLGELRMNLGLLALQEGRPAAAVVDLEQARNLLPASSALLLELTHAYRESGRLQDAQATLNEATSQVRRDERLVPAHYRTQTTQRLQANLNEQRALLELAQRLEAQGPLVWELEVAPPQPAALLRPIRSQLEAAADASDQAVRQWRRLAASESAAMAGAGLLAGGQAERLELQAVRQRYYLALVQIEQERLSTRRSPGVFDALFSTGNNDPASLVLLNELARRMPASAPIQAASGRAALVAEQAERAQEYYDQVIGMAPQAPEGFFGQGRVAYQRADVARASELYTVALERNGAFFPARMELARLAEQRGDWVAAIEQRRALRDLRPGPASSINLAHDLRLSGGTGWVEAEQLLIPLSVSHAEAAIELARLYTDAGRSDVAISAYRDALALDRTSSIASFELGETLAGQGDYAGAELALREALRLDAQHLEARLALAEIYQGPLGDPARAEREFQAALRQGVDDPTWLERIGDAALANGNAEQARTTYLRAVEQRPDSAVLQHKLGLAYAARSQHEAAAEAQRRAIELLGAATDPAANELRIAAWVSLGDALRLQGRNDEAINAYTTALQLDAGRIAAQIGQGLVAVGAGNWGVAHGHFATAAALPNGDQNAEAQFWLAESLLRRDDFAGASARYQRALELRPNFPEAYLGLAQTRYAQHDLEAALATINSGLAQRPLYAEALLFKGKLLQEQGRNSEALAAYDRSITADAAIAESHYRRGMLRIQLGDYDAAIRDLNQAAELQANFPEATYWLGRAYYAQGRLEPALRAFRQAISYNAGYVEAILYSGLVAEDLGLMSEAISAYQTVIQIDAQSELATRARLQLNRLS
jgi:tetratricopeptide (TPR) repeat protein